MPIKLEPVTEQDLESILLLQKRAFHGQALIYNDFTLPPLTQTIEDLKNEFSVKSFYKVEMDEKIIASIRCHIRDDVLHIEKIIVDPDYQNRGIGTAILHEVEAIYSGVARRYSLFTGDKSTRNIHLYKKLGYRVIKHEPTNRGHDLVYMEKNNDKKAK